MACSCNLYRYFSSVSISIISSTSDDRSNFTRKLYIYLGITGAVKLPLYPGLGSGIKMTSLKGMSLWYVFLIERSTGSYAKYEGPASIINTSLKGEPLMIKSRSKSLSSVRVGLEQRDTMESIFKEIINYMYLR